MGAVLCVVVTRRFLCRIRVKTHFGFSFFLSFKLHTRFVGAMPIKDPGHRIKTVTHDTNYKFSRHHPLLCEGLVATNQTWLARPTTVFWFWSVFFKFRPLNGIDSRQRRRLRTTQQKLVVMFLCAYCLLKERRNAGSGIWALKSNHRRTSHPVLHCVLDECWSGVWTVNPAETCLWFWVLPLDLLRKFPATLPGSQASLLRLLRWSYCYSTSFCWQRAMYRTCQATPWKKACRESTWESVSWNLNPHTAPVTSVVSEHTLDK